MGQILDTASRTSKMNRFLMEHHEDDMVIAIALQDIGTKIKTETTIDGKGNRRNIALALSDLIGKVISNLSKPIQLVTVIELNDRIMNHLERDRTVEKDSH